MGRFFFDEAKLVKHIVQVWAPDALELLADTVADEGAQQGALEFGLQHLIAGAAWITETISRSQFIFLT